MPPEAQGVYSFVRECVEKEAVKVIYEVGKNGGYFFPPNKSTDSGVAIYYENGKDYMPSKKQIEDEISFFMNKKLFFCTKNFVDFTNLEITQGDIGTKTTIMEDEVILDVDYPITINNQGGATRINDFRFNLPVRMGIIHDSINYITQEQLSHESICASCLLEISEKNDLYVEIMDYDENTMIFIFRDENSKINEVVFVWAFANKYKIE
ncbi:hypothetical protein J4233_06435 [Candidatus Pacearchaeota archaeon]|nr:hypothetical protein [Candidatus Pacearchaeota archaeon]